jgi:hypothetical protein
VWVRGFGANGWDFAAAVTSAPANGDVMVTGGFMTTVQFGDDPASQRLSAGGLDVFVASYTASGGYLAAAAVGGPFDDAGHGVASSVVGAAVVGQFTDAIDLAGTTYMSAGADDLLVVATSQPPFDDGDL